MRADIDDLANVAALDEKLVFGAVRIGAVVDEIDRRANAHAPVIFNFLAHQSSSSSASYERLQLLALHADAIAGRSSNSTP